MTDTQNKAHFSSALPLVTAQPGIWMAEQVAERSGTFTVAHYVEFHSEPNCELFNEAVRRGLAAADMVHARFGENDAGEPASRRQRLMGQSGWTFSQAADAEMQALAWMKAEMTQPLSTAGEAPLWHQALIRLEAFPALRWF